MGERPELKRPVSMVRDVKAHLSKLEEEERARLAALRAEQEHKDGSAERARKFQVGLNPSPLRSTHPHNIRLTPSTAPSPPLALLLSHLLVR